MNADQLIAHYNMEKHPEGGAFLETYRSQEKVQLGSFSGERSLSTGIYFLLKQGEFSAFHKIKSDEMWHFYLGESLRIIEIDLDGKLTETILGRDILNGEKLQYTVAANHWFASIPNTNSKFSFVGCSVSPGFDFQDFELATNNKLSNLYPNHSERIKELTYE
jgi:predicted cupin superfamily sugar epimerase